MGIILVQAIFDKVQRISMDELGVRWEEPELLGWLNSAQREIVFHKPNSAAVNAVHALVAGTKQTIPPAGLMLIDVIRNMGSGTTPGRTITAINRDALDGALPDWHSSTASAVVKHFVYDVRDPKTFYVYPPQPTGTAQKVELVYPVAPTDLTAASQAIGVDDIYEARLVDYILYRAYSKGDGAPSDAALAAGYANAFYTALGVKLQAESQFAPSKKNLVNSPQG
jgi:hypothetical protein